MNMQIPATIQCYECQQNLTRQRFAPSNIQQWLTRLHDQHRWGKNKQVKGPVCVACTPQTAVEKECGRCSETKGMDEFSGNQRAKGDGFCIECTNEISNLNVNDSINPDFDQQYTNTEYGSESGTYWCTPSYTSTRPTLRTVNSEYTHATTAHFLRSSLENGSNWINSTPSSEHVSRVSSGARLRETTGADHTPSSASSNLDQSTATSGAQSNTSYSSWSDFPRLPRSNLSAQNHGFASQNRSKRF